MKQKAVVIDDSKVMRRVLGISLERAGFEVVAEGETGTVAVELYEQHRPDLITLDIVLPGMDGVGAAEQILRRNPNAVVVMCSSINSRDKILRCRELGVRHFILKPFTIEKVIEVLTTLHPEVRAPPSEVRP